MTAVLVTHQSDEVTPLVRALRAEALRVHAVPTIELVPVPAKSKAGRRVRRLFWALRASDWIVVTSRYGAAVAARHVLLADGLSHPPVRWAAIGGAAADALIGAGIEPDVTAPVSDPHSLVTAMAADGRLSNRRVLVARSDAADRWLPQVIAAAGALVHDVATYQTVEGPSWGRSALLEAMSDPDLRAIVIASGSAARGLIAMVEGESSSAMVGILSHLERVRDMPTITIGPATTAAACSVGLRVTAEADEPTVVGIVGAVTAALASAGSKPTRPLWRIRPMTLVTPTSEETATAGSPQPSAAHRPRRLRTSPAIRALVRETRLDPGRLIAPLFVHTLRDSTPIASLPGHARLSRTGVVEAARELAELGVGGILLFGIPDWKDPYGESAADPEGPVPEALRLIRALDLPLALIADVCLCEYTTHGHCGVLDGDRVANDRSLRRLSDAAVAYAEAGADIVAPSAMLDGQVAAIRAALDGAGQINTSILAYAAKHASSLYGPFRDAAGSAPAFGDRRSYQMDPANGREALRELEIDAAEGADILMVKPAGTNLDVLARARERFDLPLAAYQVSGEVAMLEAAAERGWLDRRAVALELLTAIARSGADLIVTYLAADAARWLGDPDRPQ